jgi:hemolysin D
MGPANSTVVPFPRPPVRRRDYELSFLPAALEIAERPPSPIGRAIAATTMGIFSLALLWATLGSVDVVASARGKIIPSGGTKLVQPFDTGVVRAIRVHDGQYVKAGESLIELDPTMTSAELDHSKAGLIAAQLEVARLRASLAGHDDDPLADFKPPEGATPAQIAMQREFLTSQTAEQGARLAEIDHQISQKEAERATVSARIAKLEATIPVLQQRYDIQKALVDKQLVSKLTYLSEFQELIGQQQDLAIEQSQLKEADAAIAALRKSREQAVAAYRHSLLDGLAKSEQRAAELTQDVIKSERRTKLQALTAPVDGVIQQLAVHTVGGVVTPAQVLAVVVPLDSQLEIEATLSNADVGFVHAGQEAEIKVDTFNFSRYGLLHGRVLSVSRDAIERERGQPGTSGVPSAEGRPPDAQDSDLGYSITVSLEEKGLQVDDRTVELGPGMAITVEVKTGSRRIISYLLSPFAEYRHDVLRER